VWRVSLFAHFVLIFSWSHNNDESLMADIEQAAAADIRTSIFVCNFSRIWRRRDGKSLQSGLTFHAMRTNHLTAAVSIFQGKTK
jgi:hypothetical protein